MNKINIYLAAPYEGRNEEQFNKYIQDEITKLKNIFHGYEITVIPRLKERSWKKAVHNCDICAMGDGWIYIPECETIRKYAVSESKPIVITDTDYTRSFIREIVAKATRNRK